MRIVILGPDGAGKSSVIRGLVEKLNLRGCAVEVRHLKPRIVFAGRGEPVTIVVDPHGKPPRSAFLSMVKIVVWLFEEWYAQIFLDKRDCVLLCDRYYHDLLIDPKRYRYGGPHWAARLIGGLMPRPKLWILLDAPPAVLRARKQEVSPQETVYGYHANEAETALLLAAGGQYVKAGAVCDYYGKIGDTKDLLPERAGATFAWVSQDVSKTGIMGDAPAGTAEKGERWIAESAQGLAQSVADLCKEGKTLAGISS